MSEKHGRKRADRPGYYSSTRGNHLLRVRGGPGDLGRMEEGAECQRTGLKEEKGDRAEFGPN